MNSGPTQIISFAGFELDVERRRLTREGEPLHLNAKTFDLLVFLAENAGRIVTKDEILDAVWENQFVEEGNLKVQMSALRKALGEQKDNHRLLVTIPGKGYKFVGEIQNGDHQIVIESHRVSRLIVDEEISESRAAAGVLPARKHEGARNGLFVAVGAFAILSIIASGIFWFSGRNQNSGVAASASLEENQIQIKRLTAKGNVNSAVLSPDGKFFVYALGERGSYRSSLWLGQTGGSSDTQLLPPADLSYYPRSFSADGNWLYYTATEPRSFDNGSLYKMRVLGGVPQKLLGNISVYAVLSPDEKQVASVRRNSENKTSALVITNIDGTGERELAVRPSEQSLLIFSLSWSADGSLLAFSANSGNGDSQELFTANTVDGTVTQLTALDWTGVVRVSWQADGRSLVAIARDKDSIIDRQLWRVEYPSGKAHKISRDLLQYATLSLSADSNSLLAVQAMLESQIWLAPADDLAAAQQITFSSSGLEGWYGLDWTPDGRVIYAARVDQSLTLWSMDASGANVRQITSAGFQDEKPSVTADGKYIVFQSNRSGTAEIWSLNSDGSDLRQLTFGGNNTVPHSTPDSKAIIYSHLADGVTSLWRISIDGGEAVRITDKPSSNARVSPDGTFIACSWSENGKAKLAIVPITGGAPRKLFDVPPAYNFASSIRWTRDGRFISYRDWVNGVWPQSVDGGKPVRLEGLPAEKLLQYDWSPDGEHFAFARGRESRDVVMISNLRSF